MSNLSDYEVEQIMFKLKINKKSKELSNRKLDVLEKDPEVKALDEYITRLKRGEISVKFSNEENLDSFEETSVVLPELGEVIVYEPEAVSENRKKDAFKKEFEEKDEDEKNKNLELAKYSVISLKDENDMPFDLVVDENGNDVGKIVFDENGKNNFIMAPELKNKIDENLIKANVRSFVEDKVVEEEFYLKNVDYLVEAIKDGKLVPESVKETGERAIAAKKIADGENYTEIDADKAIMKTPEELEKEDEYEKESIEKVNEVFKNDRDSSLEKERDITAEKNLENDIEKEEKLNSKEENEEKDNNFNNSIPEEKKDEINKFCDENDMDSKEINAVLIIKEPETLADATENNHINRKGNEVTVIQFSGIAGKDRYIMIQDDVQLGGEEHDEAFANLIEPLHRTTGEVKRVEDDKTTLDYTDYNGELQSMKLKRIPQDMTLKEKEDFKYKLEKDMETLKMVKDNDPENVELIDKLEGIVYQDFVEAGLIPPEEIKEAAEETREEPEEEDKTVDDEDDLFDEIGRLNLRH